VLVGLGRLARPRGEAEAAAVMVLSTWLVAAGSGRIGYLRTGLASWLGNTPIGWRLV
jgi:hypothetical protein